MQFHSQIVTLGDLLPQNYHYRKIKSSFDFSLFIDKLSQLETSKTYLGFGFPRLFLCSLLQYMEDLSDRELAEYLQTNVAGKWFCEFDLFDKTPQYSTFSKFRAKLGLDTLSELFNIFSEALKKAGYINENFTFIDASHLISKSHLWKERDKVIQRKYDTLNNSNVSQVSHDKEAKIGCKGGSKYWYGYKKHVSVDMQRGLINKVVVTPANVTDGDGFEDVCPDQGAIYMDKGYCGKKVEEVSKRKGVVSRAIKRTNMKDKDRDLDRYISKIRSPYERVFSHSSHKARYVGVRKNQFMELFKAIGFNIKRLVVLIAEPCG